MMKKFYTGVCVLALALSACSDEEEPLDGGIDGDIDDGGDLEDAEGGLDEEGGLDGSISEFPEPWSSLDWHSLAEEGDPISDCRVEDTECEADITQLSYAVDEGVLHLALRFDGPFRELDAGAFEIFIFPPAVSTGHSIRSIGGALTFWDAECASALKHSGCHWSFAVELEGFVDEWVDDDLYICQIPLSTYGWESIDELLLGVAAAPFVIQVTADFTDRYPDEVWVTATSVEGLMTVYL